MRTLVVDGIASPVIDKVLILLGSPNADDGTLLPVALQKCRTALGLLEEQPDWVLLPTGGFGAHFNRTQRPHWWYVREWFVQHGVAAPHLLDGVDSFNTLDDAVFSRHRLSSADNELPEVRVLTCAYHVARASWIFEQVYGRGTVQILAAPDPEHDPALEALIAHEPESLRRHQSHWQQLLRASQGRLREILAGVVQ